MSSLKIGELTLDAATPSTGLLAAAPLPQEANLTASGALFRAGQRRLRTETNLRMVALQANVGIDPKEAEEIALLIIKYTTKDGGSAIYNAAKANDEYAVRKLLSYGGDCHAALRGTLVAKNISILKYLVGEAKIPLSGSNWYIYWGNSDGTAWWEGLDYLLSRGEKIPDLDSFLSSYSEKTPETLLGLISRGAKFSAGYNSGNAYQAIFSEKFSPQLRFNIFNALKKECNPPINQLFRVLAMNARLPIDRYPTWARRSDAQWMPIFPEKYDIGAHGVGVNIHIECSPLEFAVLNKDIQLATALLKLGADPNINSFSPIKCAKDRQDAAMIALLIQYGAKVDGA